MPVCLCICLGIHICLCMSSARVFVCACVCICMIICVCVWSECILEESLNFLPLFCIASCGISTHVAPLSHHQEHHASTCKASITIQGCDYANELPGLWSVSRQLKRCYGAGIEWGMVAMVLRLRDVDWMLWLYGLSSDMIVDIWCHAMVPQ